jgi:hypothetical protein
MLILPYPKYCPQLPSEPSGVVAEASPTSSSSTTVDSLPLQPLITGESTSSVPAPAVVPIVPPSVGEATAPPMSPPEEIEHAVASPAAEEESKEDEEAAAGFIPHGQHWRPVNDALNSDPRYSNGRVPYQTQLRW